MGYSHDQPSQGPAKSEIYGPRVIFVWEAIQWLQCTPWVNPCDILPIPDPKVGQLDFMKYCELRADLEEFIKPLFGCHLICDCKYDETVCHAHHLKSLCTQLSLTNGPDYNNQANFPVNTQVCEHYDDSHDEIDYHGKLTSLDETMIGNKVPHCVAWPDEWRSWVDDIRAAPWKVFCELFSGSADCPHFNLLNPALQP